MPVQVPLDLLQQNFLLGYITETFFPGSFAALKVRMRHYWGEKLQNSESFVLSQFDPTSSLHVHWLAVAGMVSCVANAFHLFPSGALAGGRMARCTTSIAHIFRFTVQPNMYNF
jgi:membrane-associated protease RseP (regulator of RpoE activity)